MEFSIKEWRRTYDLVQQLGKTLGDSRPSYDDSGKTIPAVLELSLEAQHALEDKIKSLLQKSSKYLDQCGMRPNKPLWHYDRKDPKTWASHESFKYGHLLAY